MKKQVLFVINTLGGAGAEMSFLRLLNELNPDDYEMDVFVLTGQGELRERLPEYVHLCNKNYKDSPVLTREGKGVLLRTILRVAFLKGVLFVQLPYLFRTAIEMCRRKKLQADKLFWRMLAQGAERTDKKYDLAVAYIEGGSAYYVAEYVQAKKRVAFFHSDYAKSGYSRAIDRACYTAFDHVFLVSEEGKRNFLAVYPEMEQSVSLFHNPLDRVYLEKQSRVPTEKSCWEAYDGMRILSVGRLISLKAHDVSIEIMKQLKARGVKARWYVLGEGEERKKLEQLIQAYGLEHEFFLMGAVDNPYPYFAGCDLYVHISRYEGRSVAIQEAQALGCAVLASDCSGNREQIQDGVDGILEKLDVGRLTNRIEGLLKDERQRQFLCEQARNKPVEHPEDIRKLLSFAE